MKLRIRVWILNFKVYCPNFFKSISLWHLSLLWHYKGKLISYWHHSGIIDFITTFSVIIDRTLVSFTLILLLTFASMNHHWSPTGTVQFIIDLTLESFNLSMLSSLHQSIFIFSLTLVSFNSLCSLFDHLSFNFGTIHFIGNNLSLSYKNISVFLKMMVTNLESR